MGTKAKATGGRGPTRPGAKQARPTPGRSAGKPAKPAKPSKPPVPAKRAVAAAPGGPRLAKGAAASKLVKGPARPDPVVPAAPPRPPPRVLTPLPPINTGDPERDAAERRAREIEVRLQSRGIREAQARAKKVSGGWKLLLEIPLEAADRIAPR